MKHLLYIILLSLLFFSACKSRAEQKQQESNDTVVAETPKMIQDAPLVAAKSNAPKYLTFIVFFVILFIFVLFPTLYRRTHYKPRQMFREFDILKSVFLPGGHIP